MIDFLSLLADHGMLIVFVTTLAARIGAPVPASPVMVVAGGLAASGQLDVASTLAAALAANVLGDGLWYLAGRRYGHRVLRQLCRLSLTPDTCVRQSESLILRWGGRSLIAAKFVPGVSLVAPPMVGVLGMSMRRFLAFETAGALVWAGALMGLGAALREQIEGALVLLADAGAAAVAALALIAAAWIVHKVWRRRSLRRSMSMPRITVAELKALVARGEAPLILDVRAGAAAAADTRRIPGATVIALDEIAHAARGLPHDREIVTYCNCPNEVTAARAARTLMLEGVTRVRPLAGGLEAWIAAEVEPATAAAPARSRAAA